MGRHSSDRGHVAMWNHSIQYHELLLRAVPARCATALDVGCGDGAFARKLAERAGSVDAIDRSEVMIRLAQAQPRAGNIRFLHGDFFQIALPASGYDFVAALSAVHHMDFVAAIERLRDLVRPGGVLAILGLARDHSPRDFLASALAVPVNGVLRLRRGWYEPGFDVKPPTMTYREVRSAIEHHLSGARFRRLVLFRYMILWRRS